MFKHLQSVVDVYHAVSVGITGDFVVRIIRVIGVIGVVGVVGIIGVVRV
jgi:hypothetical protein